MPLLQKYKKRYKFSLYGYCLMPNHIHLILESEQLTKFMQGVNLSYAIYFNRKYKKVGHLWQDRFKSMIVNKDQYLIDCISYIEQNPLRAKIVDVLTDYQWGSYCSRVLGREDGLLDYPDII